MSERLSRLASRLRGRLPLPASHLVLVALILLLLVAGAGVSDRFPTTRNLANVLEQSATLAFLALGQTLVILTGGIDLSVGGIVSLVSVLLAGLVDGDPGRFWPVLAGLLAFGAIIGAVNGLAVVFLRVHPLVVTLGMASVLHGAALMYTRQPAGSVPQFFEEFSYGRLLGVPVSAFAVLPLFALVGFWLARTRPGRQVYAVGSDPGAARLSGIPVGRTLVLVYALCGLFAALAGAYLVARTGIGDPRGGIGYDLASITPVVIGGTLLSGGRGGVAGTLLGVLLLTLLSNLFNFMNISSFYQWIVQGVIIIVAVSMFTRRDGS